MKLLLDENLAPRLAKSLANLYPGSRHVADCGLKQSSDLDVWEYARANGFVIASKDSDFEQRSLLRGHPPKVIWLRLGNCSTREIEELLRRYSVVIHTFHDDPVEAILVLP
jgi:predicted nuclease of predicted toxin-antitoxin system